MKTTLTITVLSVTCLMLAIGLYLNSSQIKEMKNTLSDIQLANSNIKVMEKVMESGEDQITFIKTDRNGDYTLKDYLSTYSCLGCDYDSWFSLMTRPQGLRDKIWWSEKVEKDYMKIIINK